MKTTTEKLAAALHVLARDIQSDDGVANAAILEAALRLEEQEVRIKRMEKAGNEMATYAELGGIPLKFKGLINAWREAVKYE